MTPHPAAPADPVAPDDPHDPGAASATAPTPQRPRRTTPVGRPSGLRSGLASLPASVRALTLAWAALLLGASLVWPMTMGYDETAQFDMAQAYARAPFTFHDPATLGTSDAARQLAAFFPGYPPPETKTLAESTTPARGDRPTWEDLGGSHVSSDFPPNQMVQHPPLYFWMGAVILRVPGVQSLAWDQQLWLLRLLSVVLSIPVPALAYSAARRLWAWGGRGVGGPTPDRLRVAHRVGLLAAIVPLTFPNMPRDESSVNNDSLLLLSGSVLCWLLARVVTGDLRRRTAAGVGLALAVALMTKGFALVMPPVVALAYALGWRAQVRRGEREEGLRGLRPVVVPLLIAAVIVAAGSWWWVRNVLLFHTVQTDGAGPRFALTQFGQPDDKGNLWTFVPTFFRLFVELSWGGIGLPRSPDLTDMVVFGWTGLAWVGIAVGLIARRGRGERRRLLLLVTPLALTFAVCAAGSWATNKRWHLVVTGTSGRYLFHLVVVTACAVAVGWAVVLTARALRRCAPWVLVAALLTQAGAWVTILVTWYSPPQTFGWDALTHSTGQLVRWGPFDEWVTVGLVIVLPLLTGLLALALLVREARDRGEPLTLTGDRSAEERPA